MNTSLFLTEVSTYAPFNDYNISFLPYEFTIFSTDMDVERNWTETKSLTIIYEQYDYSGAIIDIRQETVLATFEYEYYEYEDGVSFNAVNYRDYYYDAVSLRVNFSFESDIAPANFYNTYYFAKEQGLVGFRTNETVFRVDY